MGLLVDKWATGMRTFLCPEPQESRRPAPGRAVPEPTSDWRRRVFKDGPIGVAVLDSDHRVIETNRAFDALIGQPVVSGTNLAAFLVPTDAEDLATALESNDGSPIELAINPKPGVPDGQTGSLYSAPLHSGARVVHLIDTPKQKKLELQFTQSQKMLAVGKLAGGIAHDFNNLLTAMNGFCDLLLLRHQPGDPSFADIMEVKQNANRVANLVRQLLAFSRQQTLQPQVLNMPDVVSDLTSLLRRLLGAGVELHVEHGRGLGKVRVDRGQLEQVLINLAVNGRDAMDGDGALTVRTRNITPDQVHQPLCHPPLPAQEWVLIEVSDTGTGIPQNILNQIFEPFFTTKPVGEGTGLGLSTVYGIVKQTDGYIYAENAPEGGARFSVYLPVYKKAPCPVKRALRRSLRMI